MAELYTPTLTYDPITDPQATQATHYQLERSPGDGFVYEAMADPITGTATPFYNSQSLIIATAGKGTRCLGGHVDGCSTQKKGFTGGEEDVLAQFTISLFVVLCSTHADFDLLSRILSPPDVLLPRSTRELLGLCRSWQPAQRR